MIAKHACMLVSICMSLRTDLCDLSCNFLVASTVAAAFPASDLGTVDAVAISGAVSDLSALWP